MAKRHPIDLEEEFKEYITLSKVHKIVDQIEQQPSLIPQIRKIMFEKDGRRSMRASWIMQHAAVEYPHLVNKELIHILKLLKRKDLETGTIRCCLGILQEIELPPKYCAEIFDMCINYIKNSTLPLAIRAFSINLIAMLCKKYPELKPEALLIINELKTYPQAPSINASVRNALKILLKL